MDRYKILKKGVFQSVKSFEEQLNASAAEGWRVVNLVSNHNYMYALIERIK